MTFTLSKPVTADALVALRDRTGRALDAGAKTILIDIDDVGTLESDTIAALIRVLRNARDHAASLSLSASRKKVLETLHITALDRVFTIVTPLATVAVAAPPKRTRRVPKKPRFIASVALAVLAASAAGGDATRHEPRFVPMLAGEITVAGQRDRASRLV